MIFLGHKLTKLRNDNNNLSMNELAEKTGIQQSNISDIESGKTKNPRESTIEKLSEFFGVNPVYFYVSGEDIAEYFPKEMSQEQIDFVLDSENIKYIKMAMKLKEAKIMTPELLDIALMLVSQASVSKYYVGKIEP